jgi:hypothetical protein
MEISTINEGSAASFRQALNENFTQLEILTGATAPQPQQLVQLDNYIYLVIQLQEKILYINVRL